MYRQKGRTRIFLISNCAQEKKAKIAQLISSLGGEVSELKDDFRCTHLVVPHAYCSIKTLCALAAGIWIVHTKYVHDSYVRGYWLQERQYEIGYSWRYIENVVRNCRMLDEPDNVFSSLRLAPTRCREKALVRMRRNLSDWNIGLLMCHENDFISTRRLLKCGGATVSRLSLPIDVVALSVDPDFFVVAQVDDIGALKPLLDIHITCVPVVYIFDYLLLDPPPTADNYTEKDFMGKVDWKLRRFTQSYSEICKKEELVPRIAFASTKSHKKGRRDSISTVQGNSNKSLLTKCSGFILNNAKPNTSNIQKSPRQLSQKSNKSIFNTPSKYSPRKRNFLPQGNKITRYFTSLTVRNTGDCNSKISPGGLIDTKEGILAEGHLDDQKPVELTEISEHDSSICGVSPLNLSSDEDNARMLRFKIKQPCTSPVIAISSSEDSEGDSPPKKIFKETEDKFNAKHPTRRSLYSQEQSLPNILTRPDLSSQCGSNKALRPEKTEFKSEVSSSNEMGNFLSKFTQPKLDNKIATSEKSGVSHFSEEKSPSKCVVIDVCNSDSENETSQAVSSNRRKRKCQQEDSENSVRLDCPGVKSGKYRRHDKVPEAAAHMEVLTSYDTIEISDSSEDELVSDVVPKNNRISANRDRIYTVPDAVKFIEVSSEEDPDRKQPETYLGDTIVIDSESEGSKSDESFEISIQDVSSEPSVSLLSDSMKCEVLPSISAHVKTGILHETLVQNSHANVLISRADAPLPVPSSVIDDNSERTKRDEGVSCQKHPSETSPSLLIDIEKPETLPSISVHDDHTAIRECETDALPCVPSNECSVILIDKAETSKERRATCVVPACDEDIILCDSTSSTNIEKPFGVDVQTPYHYDEIVLEPAELRPKRSSTPLPLDECATGALPDGSLDMGDNCAGNKVTASAGVQKRPEAMDVLEAVQEVYYRKFLKPWARMCSEFTPACCFGEPGACVMRHGADTNKAKPTDHADDYIMWNLGTMNLAESAIDFVQHKLGDYMYPPHIYIQYMLHFLMDLWTGLNTTTQGISCVHTLLKKHPPCAAGMFEYYREVLFSPLQTFDGTKQERCFAHCLIKIENEIMQMKNPEGGNSKLETSFSKEVNEMEKAFEADYKEQTQELASLEGLESVRFEEDDSSDSDDANDAEPPHVSCQRLFLLLRLFVDILEADLLSGLVKHGSNLRRYIKGKTPPLISFVLWGSQEIGCANRKCKEFIKMYLDLFKYAQRREYAREFERILTLIAEVVYASETNPSSLYPHIDEKCELFANMWAKCIFEAKLNIESVSEILNSLRPDWVQLCVSRSIFEHLTEQKIQLSLRPMISFLRDLSRVQIEEYEPEELILTYRKNQQHKEPSSDVKLAEKRDSKGETKLHVLGRNNRFVEMKRILSTPGIDINIKDNAGWTPLHEAAFHGSVDCVELLLNYRTPAGVPVANPYTKNNDGITALMDAAVSNKLGTATLLVAYGGKDLLNATYKGQTILDMAASEAMKEILLGAPEVGTYNLVQHIPKKDQAKMLHILPIMIRAYAEFSEIRSITTHLIEGKVTSIKRGKVHLKFDYLKWKQDYDDFKVLQKVIKEFLEERDHPLYEELIFLL